jgi:hypothetical protein
VHRAMRHGGNGQHREWLGATPVGVIHGGGRRGEQGIGGKREVGH